MEPQQVIFSYLLTELRARGLDVYDGALPPEGTPYPFVYLADSQMIDDNRKDAVQGTVYQTIHVWHNNPRERGTLSAIMLAVKDVCRELERIAQVIVAECDSRIMSDIPDGGASNDEQLMHGIIEVGFKF